ncbi:tRNA (N(6)-L-threonylcarbamoyladenosine(37)-C(2))-methylthiotransferase MtaB [Candidatus Margulisiibacteriota bacterium]
MQKKVIFFTQGCRTNQAETQILTGQLANKGCQIVKSISDAEIAIVNTCIVTKNADKDIQSLINKINRQNPDIKIVLIGCQSQIRKQELLGLPNVKLVIGNENKMNLVELLSTQIETINPKVLVPEISGNPFKSETFPEKQSRTRANLKIQDGCNSYCSYCIVPYARGPSRSREFENILEEAIKLISFGFKEIVLTGINIGLYQYQEKTFIDVLSAVADISKNCRIRISSIEPMAINSDIISLIANHPQICRFLHIPLQSGSDKILEKMDRKYTTADFQKLILDAKNVIPNIGLGTDVIVGFPGETDADFNDTYAFLKQLPLSYFHVFPYSKREGTKSAGLKDTVSISKIQERSAKLRALSQEKKSTFYKSQLDSTHNVLFEEKKQGYWTGFTDNYIRIHIKSNQNLQNQLKSVKIGILNEKRIY